jgi:S-methylmethionine-dependent homocysteine/selenocysteine methylase
MKTKPISFLLTVTFLMITSASRVVAAGPDFPKPVFTGYDEKADGVQQVAQALADARSANKRVLLQLGVNSCGPCRKLHALFADDRAISAEIQAHYVVVYVDVDGDHNKAVDARYDFPTQYGLPVLVVLGADGKLLKTQDSVALEEGNHHSRAKVLAFLKTWSGKP